ncbi:hypothetical protein [Embleya sp. NPDC005971]|uniref:hypothetical protein n=1 Tax=Embleya sp. NPDC005971 TaxID=3156724 RepID=UPI0033C3B1BE
MVGTILLAGCVQVHGRPTLSPALPGDPVAGVDVEHQVHTDPTTPEPADPIRDFAGGDDTAAEQAEPDEPDEADVADVDRPREPRTHPAGPGPRTTRPRSSSSRSTTGATGVDPCRYLDPGTTAHRGCRAHG